MVVDSADEARPVGHTSAQDGQSVTIAVIVKWVDGSDNDIPCQASCMNKVEIVSFILPSAFEILHDKLDVRGHPAGLNRTDIVPNDVGVG